MPTLNVPLTIAREQFTLRAEEEIGDEEGSEKGCRHLRHLHGSQCKCRCDQFGDYDEYVCECTCEELSIIPVVQNELRDEAQFKAIRSQEDAQVQARAHLRSQSCPTEYATGLLSPQNDPLHASRSVLTLPDTHPPAPLRISTERLTDLPSAHLRDRSLRNAAGDAPAVN